MHTGHNGSLFVGLPVVVSGTFLDLQAHMGGSAMTEEDADILEHSGLLGHRFALIIGDHGHRRSFAECNDLESAKRLGRPEVGATVYEKQTHQKPKPHPKGLETYQWVEIWNRYTGA